MMLSARAIACERNGVAGCSSCVEGRATSGTRHTRRSSSLAADFAQIAAKHVMALEPTGVDHNELGLVRGWPDIMLAGGTWKEAE